MNLTFTKMHGLGNDFIVFDATRRPIELSTAQIRFLANRRFGVGCDQILLIEPPREPASDFYYRIYNADGSEVEQCGNGARCFARYVHNHGLSDKPVIRVGTARGPIELHVLEDEQIGVDMGPPRLDPADLPFAAPQRAILYPLTVEDKVLEVSAVSMGNPHAVLLVDSVEQAPVATLGPLVESHPAFPQRVNVGFMEYDHLTKSIFGYSNAAAARPWPAVPVPARRWLPVACAACSKSRYGYILRVGIL